MAYSKTTWKDRAVQKPLTYTLQNNADGTTTLIPAEGTIVEPGTAITASTMNKLETQYDEAVNYINTAPTWKSLTAYLQNGSTAGTITPQYAIVGRKAIFRGSVVVGTYGTNSFTLPAEARPTIAANPVAVNTTSGRNGGIRAFVSTGGVITFFGTINNGDGIDLTSMEYYLD